MAARRPLPLTSPMTTNVRPTLKGNDLKEIASHFGGGTIDAFDGITGDGRQVVRDHDALDLVGGGHFAFERSLFGLRSKNAPAFADGDVDESYISESDSDHDGQAVE